MSTLPAPKHALPVLPPEAEARKASPIRYVGSRFGILLSILCVVLFHASAHAQEDPDAGVWLSRQDAARADTAAALAVTLQAEVDALHRQVALLQQIDALQIRLIETADRVAAGETHLRELAEAERDVYKTRAERIESEGEKGRRWLQCRAWAGAGVLAGGAAGSIFMGVGAIPGAAAGAIAGCVAGLLGAP